MYLLSEIKVKYPLGPVGFTYFLRRRIHRFLIECRPIISVHNYYCMRPGIEFVRIVKSGTFFGERKSTPNIPRPQRTT